MPLPSPQAAGLPCYDSLRRWLPGSLQRWLPGLLLSLLVCGLLPPDNVTAQPNDGLPYRIAKQTTWFVEPLRSDGQLDWRAIFVSRDRGIPTDENSAALLVPLMQIGNIERAGLLKGMGLSPEDWQESPRLNPQVAEVESQYAMAAMRPWQATQFPELASWIDDHEQVLETIREASRRQYYRPSPIMHRDEPLAFTILPDISEFRGIARLVLARATLSMGEGHAVEAMDDIQVAMRLARQLESGSCLIVAGEGARIHREACTAMAALIGMESELMNQQWNELIEAWGDCRRAIDPAVVSVAERVVYLEAMDRLIRHDRPETALEIFSALGKFSKTQRSIIALKLAAIQDWNPVLEDFNRHYNQANTALACEDPLQRAKQLQAFVEHADTIDRQLDDLANSGGSVALVDANEMARRIVSTSGWEMAPSLYHSEIKTVNRHRLVALGLALRQYHQQTGAFPDSLESLSVSPDSLVDLFSGQPYRYELSANGFRLYSTGPNGEDEGITGEPDPEIDDWGVAWPRELEIP